MRSVRSAIIATVLLIGCAGPGVAADMGDYFLRGSEVPPGPSFVPGSPVYPVWSGFYAGGDIGTSSGGIDFGNSTQSIVAFLLRNTTALALLKPDHWTTLEKGHGSANGWGAFAGYNSQWDSVIVGLELNYYKNASQFKASSSDSMGRSQVSGTTRFDVNVTANSSLELLDYGTLRGRAGWIIGNFLPYATLGVAVGRANVSRNATVYEAEYDVTDVSNPILTGGGFSESQTKTKKNDYIYGFAAGLGVDYMLTQNIFLRAQWEWVNFSNIEGVRAYMNTGRLGAAFKF